MSPQLTYSSMISAVALGWLCVVNAAGMLLSGPFAL